MSNDESIRIQCPNCRRRLRAAARASGKSLRCPNCAKFLEVVIPSNDARHLRNCASLQLSWTWCVCAVAMLSIVVGLGTWLMVGTRNQVEVPSEFRNIEGAASISSANLMSQDKNEPEDGSIMKPDRPNRLGRDKETDKPSVNSGSEKTDRGDSKQFQAPFAPQTPLAASVDRKNSDPEKGRKSLKERHRRPTLWSVKNATLKKLKSTTSKELYLVDNSKKGGGKFELEAENGHSFAILRFNLTALEPEEDVAETASAFPFLNTSSPTVVEKASDALKSAAKRSRKVKGRYFMTGLIGVQGGKGSKIEPVWMIADEGIGIVQADGGYRVHFAKDPAYWHMTLREGPNYTGILEVGHEVVVEILCLLPKDADKNSVTLAVGSEQPVIVVFEDDKEITSQLPTDNETVVDDNLQGTWSPTNISIDGPGFTGFAGEAAQKLMKWVIEGDTVTIKGEDKNGGLTYRVHWTEDRLGLFALDRAKKLKFTLDSSKKPAAIDLQQGNCTLPGIYSLENGELKICLDLSGKKRPNDFEVQEGTPHSLFVLKKAK
jgi:uncharacterized protein (TIGR03067 family)